MGYQLVVMCNAASPCSVGWFEVLPPSCPPATASDPDGEDLYRIVAPTGPSAEDYDAEATLDPAIHITTNNACRAKSLSLWNSEDRVRKIQKMPRHQGGRIVLVRLPNGAGVIVANYQTGHYSWWRCGAFDPVANSIIVP